MSALIISLRQTQMPSFQWSLHTNSMSPLTCIDIEFPVKPSHPMNEFTVAEHYLSFLTQSGQWDMGRLRVSERLLLNYSSLLMAGVRS